ncbi:YggS family pyridoxal phosphate-dependent enzyme [Arenibacter algicola]|uniref:Pyridoxal phosphate homeostasis protein n=1 Tax=Arenibacter algicola TaxID=616991 RepID=A0A221URV6_9FLAO|nr:YggS family pyridoxal phosphate-dependent enzyme [Arenibacter algicola]ASO04042.1 YggS family pyridoxal phosphate enzyme [Arenibacter algicola]
MNNQILNNLNRIQQRIENACIKSNRNSKEVKLLLATKTVTAERIKIALQSGQTLIGENKVQEIKEKYDVLKSFPHESHFIGHLQTNKIKELLKYNVSCIQSIDHLRFATKLHQRLAFENKEIDVFIQVNTSNEQSKFGVHPDNTIELVKAVSVYENIHIKGLMTIGLFSAEEDKIRSCFQKLKNLQQEIQALQIPNVEMKELSMGMSGDLEIAIAEGATIVRVGTAIFGERIYPDSYYWNETKN